MTRNFLALLLLAAFTLTAGGLACANQTAELDKSDEAQGAT